MTPAAARWHRPLGKVCLLLLYLLAGAVALGVNPFKSQTITPFDVLISQRAWSFVNPHVKVKNYQRSDILNSRLPQWQMAREQIRQGHLPEWNDKIAGGGTFLTVNTDLYTPAFAIYAATPDPALGFYLAMLGNLVIAGLGMHLFLRRHVGFAAAMLGAVTFQVCGFNAAWLYWPHVFTLIWAPWLLYGIDRAAILPGLRPALVIAGASALTCLGGFPFLSVLVMETGALYALIRWSYLWKTRKTAWHFACWYVMATLLGLVLAALPLIGLVQWLAQFDLGYRQARGSYLNLHHIVQLFPPWAYRVQKVEQTMYVGVVMITLAMAALIAIPMRWRRIRPLPLFAVLLTLISAGLVFGLWPMSLIGWLPGMAYNSWSRAIGLLDIALITLGAIAFHFLWGLLHGHRRLALRLLLIIVAVGQAYEMGSFFRDYNGRVPSSYFFPEVPTIDYMRNHVGPFDYVITDQSFLFSGTVGTYGLREWLAHYFRTPKLQKVLHRMAKHPFYTHVASGYRQPASDIRYESQSMAAYNVRYIAIDSRQQPPKGEDSHFKRVFAAKGTAVYENDASPDGPYFLQHLDDIPDAQSGIAVTVEHYQPTAFTLRYTGNTAGFVVAPMSVTADWHVSRDGQPVHYQLKDGVLPAIPVQVPTTIEFRYEPRVLRWFYPWFAIILALLFGMIWAQKRLAGPDADT